MDIFKLLDEKFDLSQQIKNISEYIINNRIVFPKNNVSTLEDFFENNYFYSWSLSYGRNSLKELREDSRIFYSTNNIGNNKECFNTQNGTDAIRYLQYILNIIHETKNRLNIEYGIRNFYALESYVKRINYVLQKMGQQIVLDEVDGHVLIIPCNEKVQRACQKLSDKDETLLLFEYTSELLKGDINAKKDILQRLANLVEPIIQSNKEKYPHGKLFDIFKQLGFILNNFNIRHNNIDCHNTKKYKSGLSNLSDSDYEKIYDACYDLILDAILINDLEAIEKNINEIKEKAQIK